MEKNVGVQLRGKIKMKKPPIHKNIRLLTWFNFFLFFRPYAPIAILYFTEITGSFAMGLSIFSIISITSALFEVPTGLVSDLVGRKESVIFGSIASILGVGSFALAQGAWPLVLGAFFMGLSETFFSGNNDALIYDTLKEQNRQEEYAETHGKTHSMFEIGLAISALIGGLIAAWSFKLAFWVAVVFQIACLIISFFLVEPKKHYEKVSTNVLSHIKESLQQFKKNWKLRNLSMASILGDSIDHAQYEFTTVFNAMIWPTWALGISKFLSNISAAWGYRMAGRLVKKMGELKLIFWGESLAHAINLFALVTKNFFSPILMPLTSFFFGTSQVAQSTLLQQEFTEHQRATMGSLNNLFGSIFFSIIAVLFGFLADEIGPVKSLIVGEVLLFLPMMIYWRIFKKS